MSDVTFRIISFLLRLSLERFEHFTAHAIHIDLLFIVFVNVVLVRLDCVKRNEFLFYILIGHREKSIGEDKFLGELFSLKVIDQTSKLGRNGIAAIECRRNRGVDSSRQSETPGTEAERVIALSALGLLSCFQQERRKGGWGRVFEPPVIARASFQSLTLGAALRKRRYDPSHPIPLLKQ